MFVGRERELTALKDIDRFYYTIQKECYFRDKNPDWNGYHAYQKKLWFEKS